MVRPEPRRDTDGHIGGRAQYAAVEAVHPPYPEVQRRRRADEPGKCLELLPHQGVEDEVTNTRRLGLKSPHKIQRHPAEVHQQHHHQRDEQLRRLQRHPQRIGQPHERQRLTKIHPLQSDTVRSVGHRTIIRQRINRAAGVVAASSTTPYPPRFGVAGATKSPVVSRLTSSHAGHFVPPAMPQQTVGQGSPCRDHDQHLAPAAAARRPADGRGRASPALRGVDQP